MPSAPQDRREDRDQLFDIPRVKRSGGVADQLRLGHADDEAAASNAPRALPSSDTHVFAMKSGLVWPAAASSRFAPMLVLPETTGSR